MASSSSISSPSTLSFILILLFCFLSPSSSSLLSYPPLQQPIASCTNYVFSYELKRFEFCNDLPVLNSFLHWNYDPLTRTVDIAYRHTNVDASTWVSWAINPTSNLMIGSQAFVAFQGSNGTIRAYTSPVTSYTTCLEEGPLSFPVQDISATFANKEIVIYATFQLPNGNNVNSNIINQLWQDGPLINGDTPGLHCTSGPNVQSFGTLDLLSGYISKPKRGGEIRRLKRLKNVHGVLNAVSWGVLMLVGAIIARYMKTVNSAGQEWFYLHIFCQTTAYAIGVGGWATGLVLGNKSSGIQYDAHRNIGIVLFTLATLQVLSSLKRPKLDHKYKIYWNIFHHMTGYTVIVLSIINVYKGIEILDMEKIWKNIYTAVIVFLGAIAVVLDAISWDAVMKIIRKKPDESSTS